MEFSMIHWNKRKRLPPRRQADRQASARHKACAVTEAGRLQWDLNSAWQESMSAALLLWWSYSKQVTVDFKALPIIQQEDLCCRFSAVNIQFCFSKTSLSPGSQVTITFQTLSLRELDSAWVHVCYLGTKFQATNVMMVDTMYSRG